MNPIKKLEKVTKNELDSDQIYITYAGDSLDCFILDFAEVNGIDKLKSITLFSNYLP